MWHWTFTGNSSDVSEDRSAFIFNFKHLAFFVNREDEGKLSLETSGTTGPTTQRHITENCSIQKHRALTSVGRYRCVLRAGSCDCYIYLFIYVHIVPQ